MSLGSSLRNKGFRSAAVSLLAFQLLAVFALPAGASSTTAVGFSGRATALSATLLGTTTVLGDTGPLAESGGAREASLLNASVPNLLTAKALHGTTIGQGDRSRTESSVANLNLSAGDQTVAANFLMSRAEAVCGSSGPAVTGSSQIVGLVINGQPIEVTGEPNQTVELPLGAGKVVINEQTKAVDGNKGDITVNALHITVNGVTDVVVASSHADIVCRANPSCAGKDFVTGGGMLAAPKASFGVAGGIRNGAFWGHLVHIDHTTGAKIKGTGITAYVVTSPTSRQIKGTAMVNGQSGYTYQVDVTDNGEPGRSDTYVLRVSNGYTAGGTLAGGNIQLHKPCR